MTAITKAIGAATARTTAAMPAPRPRFVTSATIPWTSAQSAEDRAHPERRLAEQHPVAHRRAATLQSKSMLIGAGARSSDAAPEPDPGTMAIDDGDPAPRRASRASERGLPAAIRRGATARDPRAPVRRPCRRAPRRARSRGRPVRGRRRRRRRRLGGCRGRRQPRHQRGCDADGPAGGIGGTCGSLRPPSRRHRGGRGGRGRSRTHPRSAGIDPVSAPDRRLFR